ncbi:putative reverse transcriptase domain-containing protein [Tanacetum coccineum]
MPPKMTTRSAGRATATLRGGRTGGRTGRYGGRTGGQYGDQGNGRINGQGGQVGGQAQVGDQGRRQWNGRNQNGDSINDNIQANVRNVIENNNYFIHVGLRRWSQFKDMSGCRDNQKVKYIAGSFVGKALTWWNSQIHIRGREAAVDPTTIQKAVQIAGTLTTEALRNGSIKKNLEKRGNGGNLERIGMERTITRGLGLEIFLLQPQTMLGENTWDCRVVPRNVNPSMLETQLLGPVTSVIVPNISRQHILGIEPSDLGFSYEIEIDRVIKGRKLEIEGHVFDINLIPFGSGSFNVIIGMDWLSDHKAEIIYHEKEIVIVRDFLEVFPDDLSGLIPIREIDFRIELVPRAIPVGKSPYRLVPSEMEELSGQLKELQDKGFIRPSSFP